MKKYILLLLGMFLISFASASISFMDAYSTPYTSYQYIYVNAESGTINFSHIVEYFEDNPIAERNITYPRNYGEGTDANPYELNEGITNEWNTTDGIITNETNTVFYGQSALAVNNTSGAFDVAWNNEDMFETNTGYRWFDFHSARELRFMVYANQSVNISLIVLEQNDGSYFYSYEKFRNDVWEIPANTWSEVRVDLVKDIINLQSRYYSHAWSEITISFDSSANVVIDGTRMVLENPTPYEKRPNHYIFPVPLYVYETDFEDDGFIFESTTPTSLDLYGRLTFDGGDVTLGSKEYGGVLIGRSPTSADNAGSYGWDFRVGAGDTYDIDGITVAGSKGVKGASIHPYTTDATATLTMDDMRFYSIGDIYYDAVSGSDFNMTNIFVGHSRYPLWGADHEYINFDGYTFNSYNIWSDKGTIRGLTPKADTITQLTYQRSYQQASNTHNTLNLINFDKTFIKDTQYMSLYIYEQAGRSNITVETRLINELNINFIDEEGNPIENVSMVINSSDGMLLDSALSGSDGNYNEDILEISIKLHENHTNGISNDRVYYYPTTGATTPTPATANFSVTDNNPMTISISKEGYISKEFIYNLTNKEDWTISLKKPQASLVLDKIVNLKNITSDEINYNITLKLTNKGEGNANQATIIDSDSSLSPYSIGALNSNSSITRFYIKTYSRNSTTYNVQLSTANATVNQTSNYQKSPQIQQ